MSNNNAELIKALNEAHNALERAINTLRNQVIEYRKEDDKSGKN